MIAVLASLSALGADEVNEGDETYYNANALYNRKLYALAEKEYRVSARAVVDRLNEASPLEVERFVPEGEGDRDRVVVRY